MINLLYVFHAEARTRQSRTLYTAVPRNEVSPTETTHLINGTSSQDAQSARLHSKIRMNYGSVAIVISLLVFISSFASLSVGGYMIVPLPALSENHTINQTLFAESNDTIILGALDANIFSMVMIEARPEADELPHIIEIFLTSKFVTHNSKISKSYVGVYLKNPQRTTGLIKNMYILDTGLIEYTFCAATIFQDRVDANAYIFDNEKHYSTYAGQAPGTTASFYAFNQKFPIGLNKSLCTSLSFPIDKSAYYSVAVDTPGSINYSYSYQIKDVYLDRMDYSKKCEITPTNQENPTCVIDLSNKTGLYYVLAYIKPNIDPLPDSANSTHLHLFANGVKQNNRDYLWTVSISLLGVGTFLFVFALCMFSFGISVICRHKAKNRIQNY